VLVIVAGILVRGISRHRRTGTDSSPRLSEALMACSVIALGMANDDRELRGNPDFSVATGLCRRRRDVGLESGLSGPEDESLQAARG
jgi:hypothetical protein